MYLSILHLAGSAGLCHCTDKLVGLAPFSASLRFCTVVVGSENQIQQCLLHINSHYINMGVACICKKKSHTSVDLNIQAIWFGSIIFSATLPCCQQLQLGGLKCSVMVKIFMPTPSNVQNFFVAHPWMSTNIFYPPPPLYGCAVVLTCISWGIITQKVLCAPCEPPNILQPPKFSKRFHANPIWTPLSFKSPNTFKII